MSRVGAGSVISFYHHQTNFRVRQRTMIRDVVMRILKDEKKNAGEISFIICNDEYLLEINRRHLQHDYFTDVISFNYSENPGEKLVAGEIYVSIDRVKENAKDYQVTQTRELMRVFIHGVLHLCGYDDHSSRARQVMTAKEDYYLSLF